MKNLRPITQSRQLHSATLPPIRLKLKSRVYLVERLIYGKEGVARGGKFEIPSKFILTIVLILHFIASSL